MKKYLAVLLLLPFFVHADASSSVPLGDWCGVYIPLIEQYHWNPVTALYVMNAESGCNPSAINLKDDHGACRGSYGLFQIGCQTATTTDPVANIAAAYALYNSLDKNGQKRMWGPWSTCTDGKVVCST